jgi:hypothetical protein
MLMQIVVISPLGRFESVSKTMTEEEVSKAKEILTNNKNMKSFSMNDSSGLGLIIFSDDVINKSVILLKVSEE